VFRAEAKNSSSARLLSSAGISQEKGERQNLSHATVRTGRATGKGRRQDQDVAREG